MAWCSYFLGKYPLVQQKARDEIDEVLQGRDPTAEDIHKLKYCKATLEETLRLRPVVPIISPRYFPEGGILNQK
jgi:cytochrome P450